MKIALVPSGNINEVLDEVGPILTRATDRSGGRWSIIDVLDQVETGLQQLWIAFTDERIWGVVTTRFAHYSATKHLEIVFCAGDDLKEWMRPMLSVLESWSRDNGATRMEFAGRRGWERVLDKEGFVSTYVIMERVVE